jgi:hypothetical protein
MDNLPQAELSRGWAGIGILDPVMHYMEQDFECLVKGVRAILR